MSSSTASISRLTNRIIQADGKCCPPFLIHAKKPAKSRKILLFPLAIRWNVWYNSKALMCAYSNKEVDFHG